MENLLTQNNIADMYSLSPMQQGMLFHSVYGAGATLYLEQLTATVEGRIDLAAFERAWNKLIEANPVLRTVFRWRNLDAPAQVVLKRYPLQLNVVDLSACAQDHEVRRRATDEFLARDRRTPLALETGPLMRVSLLRYGEQDAQLVWTFHHILFDGWSLPLLIGDLLAAYEATCAGADFTPPARRPFRDYIAWLKRQDSQAALAFWSEQLRGFAAKTSLPLATRAATRELGEVDEYSTTLDVALSHRLRATARALRVTPNALFQCAWSILLSRLSGQADVMHGITLSGRPTDLAGAEAMVGQLTSTLPMRVHVDAAQTALALAQRVQDLIVRMQPHEWIELSRLRALTALKGDDALFETLFVFENYPVGTAAPGDRASLKLGAPQMAEATNFPLAIIAGPAGDAFALRIEYARDVYDPQTIVRLGAHFHRLLGAIAARPATRIDELALLTTEEERHIRVDWNATAREYPGGATLQSLLEAQAEKAPDRVAVVCADARLRYAELNARANQLAHYLRGIGVGPDACVALCAERSTEMVVGLLGILKAGAAYLPLDPAYPSERLAYMLADAQPRALLAQERLRPLLSEVQVPVFCLDTDWGLLGHCARDNPQPLARPDNLAYVIYTSGSTGRPKGVMATHRGISNRLLWMQEEYRLTEADRVLQKTPFSFDVSVWEFFWPLMVGAGLVMARPDGHKDSAYLASIIRAERITTIHFVPSMLQAFVNTAELETCTSLRRVICSGEALPPPLHNRFLARSPAELHNLYGPTEASVDVSYWHCAAPEETTVPIGRPIANTQLHILDPHLHPVPMGVAGELYIGGIGVARGYLNRPALTAERFIPDRFSTEAGTRLYRTGDLARWRSDGSVEYLGRNDFQVKIRGFRIELGEIEAVLQAQPTVREAVVVAHEHAPGDKRLVAYLALHAGGAIDERALRAALKERLPEYMIPARWLLLERLPLTVSGKVDRQALPAPEGARPGLETRYEPPREGTEQVLAGIWRQVLKLERVGRHDNFFDLGGDSILSLQIVARLHQHKLSATPKLVFEHQTIAELAPRLGQRTERSGSAPAEVTGKVALTPIQHWFFEQPLARRAHWNHAVLLGSAARVDERAVRRALQALHDHHDALRMGYRREDDGWRQHNRPRGEAVALVVADLALHADPKTELARQGQALHETLSLEDGPLLRAGLFRMGASGDRLLLAIHHLVVDGVSWRILMEDLASAYSQTLHGEDIALPPKTDSFQTWAGALESYGQSAALHAEREYWYRMLSAPAERIEPEYPQGEDRVADMAQVRVALSTARTAQLLGAVRHAYHTEINELLLTAVLRALRRWRGVRSLLIDLEGHGREALFEGLDLSRTVGWFTSLFPVRLALGDDDDLGRDIRAVKETLRAVPNRGVGYGVLRYLARDQRLAHASAASVAFNYLGQWHLAEAASGLAPAHEPSGPPVAGENLRAHELMVNALVSEGVLAIDLIYGQARFERASLERLAEHLREELERLIVHCLDPRHGAWSASDFPLARLTETELEALPRDLDDVYGLAPLQQGLLFQALFEPESPAYFEQYAFEFSGTFDPARLLEAWGWAIAHNPVLRTVFRWHHDGEPVQLVLRQVPVPLEVHDLRALEESAAREAMAALRARDRRVPFDLARGPLFRLNLFRCAAERAVLVFSHHHIMLDGWSLPRLVGDVFNHYADTASAAARAPQRRPYRDYIAWLRGRDKDAAREFWRQHLHGVDGSTRLPNVRSAAQVPDGTLVRPLSADLATQLQERARQGRITLSTLFQAAWAVLLARYCRQDEVIFGVTVSGRPPNLEGSEDMIGPFINTVPVRVKVSASTRIDDLLAELQSHVPAAADHAYLSLAEIQHAAGFGGTSPFDSIVVFENYPVAPAEVPAMTNVPALIGISAVEMTHYPLALIVLPKPRLELRLVYRGIAAADADRLLDGCVSVIAALAAGEEPLASCLPVLGKEACQRVLVERNRTAVAHTTLDSVVEIFERQARRTPEALAVTFGEHHLSYEELDAAAESVAARLRAAGIAADDRVGLFIERSLALALGVLGTLKAGACYVPLDPEYPRDRLAAFLRESRPAVVLTTTTLRGQLPATEARVVCLDAAASEGAPALCARRSAPRFASALAYVLYTSGSTGVPKGVAMTHAALINLIQWQSRCLPTPRKTLQFASLSFDVSFQELFSTWSCGGTLVVVSEPVRRDFNALARLLVDERIERLFLPFVALEHVAEAFHRLTYPACALRDIIVAGEQLQITPRIADWVAQLPGCTLHNHYGPSETHVVTAFMMQGDPRAWPALPSIGQPIDNSRAYVLDQHLNPLPIGACGDLYIGGTALARGYLERPGATASSFLPDPFGAAGGRLYRTGDLAAWTEEGGLTFLGRSDDQVKIRGHRVEPSEVEAALTAQPGIAQAAVVAVRAADGRRELVAHLVAQPHARLEAQALRQALRQHLPDYLVPAAMRFHAELPLTPSGKINRRALAAQPLETAEHAVRGRAPRDPVEQMVAEAWMEVLQLDRVGMDDDFFALGGHSLLAMRVANRLSAALARQVPVRAVFESPTPASLATAVSSGGHELPPIQRAVPRDCYPLSHSQRRLWFLAQWREAQSAYNIPSALRLRGTLDRARLATALQRLVQRHAALRTTFIPIDGEPMQWVSDAAEITIAVEVVSGDDPAARLSVVRHQLTDFSVGPFNLETGPLVRAKLFRIADDDHVFAFVLHHLIADGWSLDVLVRELCTLYAALDAPGADALPPLPVQYVDYAQWQGDLLASTTYRDQRSYWLQRLGGELPPLQLPTDRPRPTVHSFNGSRYTARSRSQLLAALQRLCAERGVTLFMLLLAAYQTLLARLCGQTDIVVGTPVAGRQHAHTENMVGLFLNMLALRADLSDNPRFIDLLERVRESSLQAYANQDYPFDLLVDELSTQRDLSRQAVFSTTFVLQMSAFAASNLTPTATLTAEVVPFEFPQAKFDLGVSAVVAEAALAIEFEYNTELFDRETVVRMAACYVQLLEGIAANPLRRIADLPLLDASHRERVLRTFNGTRASDVAVGDLATRFRECAERNAQRIAVVCDEQSITYGELDRRSEQLAQHLLALGLAREGSVAICLERSVELITAILAVLKAGGCYVPIEPGYPDERVAYMLRDAACEVGIGRGALAERLAPHVKHSLCLARDAHAIAARPATRLARQPRADQLAYIIYTSGSTGRPKGTLLTHANVLRLFQACDVHYRFNEQDVWTLFHSYCFDFSVWEIFGALLYGGRLVVVPALTARSPHELMRLLEQHRVTVFSQTPSAFLRLLDGAGVSGQWEWSAHMRYIVFGGEALEYAALRPWYQKRNNATTVLINMYGITETTVHVTYREIAAADVTTQGRRVGRPLGDLTAYILDAHGEPQPIGVAGELYIGGAGLGRGYLGQPALTAQRFVPDPFATRPGGRLYRTGDLARFQSDGEIEYLGRLDQQVKLRGYRIEPGEIEATLLKHDSITGAVVIAAKDRGQREHLVACYSAPEPITTSALRAFVARSLPEYMIPFVFVHLHEFPLTANGKIDRSKLTYAHGERPQLDVPYLAPRNNMERKLAEIWREVLQVDRVGVQDNFFDLGGESFSAYRLMARIAEEFGKELPLAAIFQAQTIERLSERVAEAVDAEAERALILLQPGAPGRLPFFCVHPAGGDVLGFQDLARALGPDQPFYGLQSLVRFLEDQEQTTLPEMARHYVDEVLAVQPQGPYLLGGHSLGAVVAFEMARQLEQAGHKIGVLAILDGGARIESSALLDTLLLVSDTFELSVKRPELAAVPEPEMMSYLLLRAKKRFSRVLEIAYDLDLLPRGFRTRDAELFLRRIAGNLAMATRYRLQPLRHGMHVFFATEQTENGKPVDLDVWREVGLGGVNVIRVPGNHVSLVKKPHVAVLGARLRELLDRAQQGALRGNREMATSLTRSKHEQRNAARDNQDSDRGAEAQH